MATATLKSTSYSTAEVQVLTPVNDDDLYFSPVTAQRIEQSFQQFKEGKYTAITNDEELNRFFDSL